MDLSSDWYINLGVPFGKNITLRIGRTRGYVVAQNIYRRLKYRAPDADAPRVICARYLPPIVLTRIFCYDQNRSKILVSRQRLANGLQHLGVHEKNTDVLAPAELAYAFQRTVTPRLQCAKDLKTRDPSVEKVPPWAAPTPRYTTRGAGYGGNIQ